jgi:hypothetical protein
MIPIQDLFGYLTSLATAENSRLILVSNEGRRQRSNRWYGSIKEKLVSHTLRVEPDSTAFINAMITAWGDSPFAPYLTEQKDWLNELIERIPGANLRAVSSATAVAEVADAVIRGFEKTPETHEKLESIRSWIFRLSVSASVFSRMSGKACAEFLNHQGIRGAFKRLEEKKATSEETKDDALYEAISGGMYMRRESPGWLASLLDHGQLHKDDIIDMLKDDCRLKMTLAEKSLQDISTGVIYSLSDEASQKAYDLVFAELRAGKLVNPVQFCSAMRALLSASELKMWETQEDLHSVIINAISVTPFTRLPNDDEELLESRIESTGREYVRLVRMKLSSNVIESQADRIKRIFQHTGPIGIINVAGNEDDADYRAPLFASLDREQFWMKVGGLGNAEIHDVQRGVLMRLIRGAVMGVEKADSEWLLLSVPIIKAMADSRPPSISRRILSETSFLIAEQGRKLRMSRTTPNDLVPGHDVDLGDGTELRSSDAEA